MEAKHLSVSQIEIELQIEVEIEEWVIENQESEVAN